MTWNNRVMNTTEAEMIASGWTRKLRKSLDKAHGVGKKQAPGFEAAHPRAATSPARLVAVRVHTGPCFQCWPFRFKKSGTWPRAGAALRKLAQGLLA
jgi:hypothetical protein